MATKRKFSGEKKIMFAVFAVIYLVFTGLKLMLFPNETLLWHFETGIIGLVIIWVFGFIAWRIDGFLEKRYSYETNALKRVILQFVITLFILLAVRVVITYIAYTRFHFIASHELVVAGVAINIFMVLTLVLAIFAYRFFISWRQQKVLAAELEKEKTQVQYDNLKNQLNPHFLFNSLTSLNSLIFENPQLASEFLQQLSKVFRYVLENKEKNLVTVDTEINFVHHYVKLLNARFEAGLEVEFDVAEDARQKAIVPVTLQVLIENAIKHNVTQKTMPLHIRIFSNNGYLEVDNNLQKKKVIDNSNGQGLENLKNLYHYLSEKEVVIAQDEKNFSVKIPLLEL